MALWGLILFSILFSVTHIGLVCDPCKHYLTDKTGEKGFMAVYSLTALSTLGCAILIFLINGGGGPVLWELSALLNPLVYLLNLLAFFMIVLSFDNPSPAGLGASEIQARGVLRITRHPMNMGLASFALAHMISSGAVGDLFFFGSFFVVGFFGAYHQDRRIAREKGEMFKAFQEKTGIFPFAAILKGKNNLKFTEIKKPFVLLAFALFIFAILMH